MKIGRNAPCPCGSGKKYRFCCLNKRSRDSNSEVTRPNLYKKNLLLLDAIGNIFNFYSGKSWGDIKKSISREQISELYRFIAWLWPPETNVSEILPEHSSKLRALYLGDVQPELIASNIFRFSLYADEILIIDPFHNPWCLREKFNPLINPDQFKFDTLKLLYFMVMLEPFIRFGIVKLIPDPGTFDFQLRNKTWELAQERLKGWQPSQADMKDAEAEAKQHTTRFLATLPSDKLEIFLKRAVPDSTGIDIKKLMKTFENIRKHDPLAVNQIKGEDDSGQMMIGRFGADLEMTLIITQLTGSFPYTNILFKWKELLSSGDDLNETAKLWTPLTKAFQELDFRFLNNVDSKFAIEMRENGRLESFRSFLRKIWNSVGGDIDINKIDALSRDFKDELNFEYAKAKAEWNKIGRSLLKWIGSTAAGSMITDSIVNGNISLYLAGGFTVAAVIELLVSRFKKSEFRKSIPMSVFIDLSRKK
ncbi:hypothetical protein ES703_82356 [subsurface metagenome]